MIEFLVIGSALLSAIVIHEFAHGWVALKCGDTTARDAGRLTLNPIKHIDPFGTILFPVLIKLMGFTPIGWARPVPVNFSQLNNPKRDMIWVAAAGPAVNILMAVVFAVLLRFAWPPVVLEFLLLLLVINLLLAVFNMVPIPPLDGSRILMGLLPDHLAYKYARMEPYGIILLLVLLNLGLLDFVHQVVALLGVQMGIRI